MGLFKKRKEKPSDELEPEKFSRLPELPTLSELGSLQKSSFSIKQPPAKEPEESYPKQHKQSFGEPLPTFPSSETGNMISQELIKKAIAPKGIDTQTMKPVEEKEEGRIKSIEMTEKMQRMSEEKPRRERIGREKSGPIFVRIDKFESAIEGIKTIKRKIDEMEKLLTNLRQANVKEDFELSEWEKEINSIKSKIESVDKDLFTKLAE